MDFVRQYEWYTGADRVDGVIVSFRVRSKTKDVEETLVMVGASPGGQI